MNMKVSLSNEDDEDTEGGTFVCKQSGAVWTIWVNVARVSE